MNAKAWNDGEIASRLDDDDAFPDVSFIILKFRKESVEHVFIYICRLVSIEKYGKRLINRRFNPAVIPELIVDLIKLVVVVWSVADLDRSQESYAQKLLNDDIFY